MSKPQKSRQDRQGVQHSAAKHRECSRLALSPNHLPQQLTPSMPTAHCGYPPPPKDPNHSPSLPRELIRVPNRMRPATATLRRSGSSRLLLLAAPPHSPPAPGAPTPGAAVPNRGSTSIKVWTCVYVCITVGFVCVCEWMWEVCGDG